MRRRLFVIGIGAGNPDHLTIQAVNAMAQTDVFFIPEKGAGKAALANVRRDMLRRFAGKPQWREVPFDTPKRRPASDENDYRRAVSDWHEAVEEVYRGLLNDELGAGQTGAFLAWGDPSLYDSTIRILERLAQDQIDFDYEVIPGISSVQALGARHRVPLNTIGGPVLLSTDRAAADGFPDDIGSMVVMLNTDKALRAADGDLDIWWGAYVGMPEEVLVAGKLGEVVDEIERIREEARRANGWIMDIALLKRPD